MSYDRRRRFNTYPDVSQSLWNRAMSYDKAGSILGNGMEWSSQSLWNRAMSYDNLGFKMKDGSFAVSIPLEQGNVLRLKHTDEKNAYD